MKSDRLARQAEDEQREVEDIQKAAQAQGAAASFLSVSGQVLNMIPYCQVAGVILSLAGTALSISSSATSAVAAAKEEDAAQTMQESSKFSQQGC